MATKEITTWAEFKNAWSEQITESTTYEIKNDIDASNEIINTMLRDGNNKTKIFNGNGYKLNGLTSYSAATNQGIFLVNNSERYFNNLHFSNFMCANTFLFYNNVGATFNNCYFSGLCYTMFNGSSGNIMELNNCSINVKCKNLWVNVITMNSCYIIVNPLSPNDTNALYRSATSLWSVGNNNYFGGTISLYSDMGSYDYPIPQRGENNVFNMNINIPGTVTSKNFGGGNIVTSLINIDRIKNEGGVSVTPTGLSGTCYKLTDEQMKNKTYIQNNTTFPLYG